MNETLLDKLKSKEYTDQIFADKQDELKEILRILENENAGPDARSEAYKNIGNLFYNLDRYEEAEQAYRKALEVKPDYAAAYYNLGILFSKIERNEEAEQDGQEGSEIKKIRTFHLENFTVFEKADFEFCPGINVLIGPNGTGKTHVMKVLYILLKLVRYVNSTTTTPDNFFANVFQIKDIQSLIRLQDQNKIACAILRDVSNESKIEIHNNNGYPFITSGISGFNHPLTFCFIPSREFLSINEGFISLYERREVAYDETYYNLSIALDAPPLRREKLTGVQHILDYLARLITGQDAESKELLSKENGRFYFNLPEGRLDVHLVADGYRKLATLYYLLRNGSLTKGCTLFWDEPEGSLNPKLIVETVRVLKMLVEAGMQIFLATHDYLLSYELSLMSEYPDENNNVDIKFFALHKPDRASGVQVESGKTLAEIENNPILQEFAAHYDRESELFHRSGDEEE